MVDRTQIINATQAIIMKPWNIFKMKNAHGTVFVLSRKIISFSLLFLSLPQSVVVV